MCFGNSETSTRSTSNVITSYARVGVFGILIVGTSLILGSIYLHVQQSYRFAKWQETRSSYDWVDGVDLRSIEGQVQLDPQKHLAYELSLVVRIQSDEPLSKLTFTLNPGMKIKSISVDNVLTRIVHQLGILELEPSMAFHPGKDYLIDVTAEGIPDPNFAYVDSAVDYLRDPSIPPAAIEMVGEQGSVFDRNFVALMPGSYWYPTLSAADGSIVSNDYFELNLQVQTTEPDWLVVGPGVSNSGTITELRPRAAVADVGLFAAQFETVSMQVDGTTFTLYLHKKHAQNLKLPELIHPYIREWLTDKFSELTAYNLEPHYQTFSIVEVPHRLRLVGGGWRMSSATVLSGVLVLPEAAYPSAPIHTALAREMSKTSTDDRAVRNQFRLLRQYLEYGLGPDNVRLFASELLIPHAGRLSNPESAIHNEIFQTLIARFTPNETPGFSIYATMNAAKWSRLSLLFALSPRHISTYFAQYRSSEVNNFKFQSRNAVWDLLETIDPADLPTPLGHQADLELVMLKGRLIAEDLLRLNGRTAVYAWLADMYDEVEGTSSSFEELFTLAQRHNVRIDPFMTSYLNSTELPEFRAIVKKLERVADDTDGTPRFQTSVVIRNVGEQDGIAHLHYLHPDRIFSMVNTPAVYIQAHTVKQLNIITNKPLDYLTIAPGLSLNRQEFSAQFNPQTYTSNPDALPSSFEEPSDWRPLAEPGLVVDDLDVGFRAHQNPLSDDSLNFWGPVAWFVTPLALVDFDHSGLLVARSNLHVSGMWERVYQPSAYGAARHSLVRVRGGKAKLRNTVSFATQIPESNLWNLSFYVPSAYKNYSSNIENLKLQISDNTNSWEVQFNPTTTLSGWRFVDKFDLQAGDVTVEIIGSTKPGPIYADAIMWSLEAPQ